jgi:hypothetical protein
MERFRILNDFVDLGLAQLSRSEIVIYLILFRDTKSNGLARTSLSELVRRGGMSIRQASRSLNALIQRGAVRLIQKPTADKAAMYSLYSEDSLARLNPDRKAWNGKTAAASDN